MLKSAAEELVSICHAIHRKGLVSGSGGNVSVKVNDGILITPSGVALESISVDNLVLVNYNGEYKGSLKPSKETFLHLDCYAARPNIKAVIHVHSVNSVALSCKKDINVNNVVPVYTPGYAIRIGRLPVIPYYKPGSPELAESVSEVIRHRNTVLLRNHGVVSVGQSLDAAMNLVEEIEENAKISFLLSGSGVFLSDAEIDELYTFVE